MQYEESNVPNPTSIHHSHQHLMNRDKDNLPSVLYNSHITTHPKLDHIIDRILYHS